MSSTRYSHSPVELAAVEQHTGLVCYGWLSAGPELLPIFGQPGRSVQQRRAIVLRLNGRAAGSSDQVEGGPPVEGRAERPNSAACVPPSGRRPAATSGQ